MGTVVTGRLAPVRLTAVSALMVISAARYWLWGGLGTATPLTWLMMREGRARLLLLGRPRARLAVAIEALSQI